MGDGGGSIGSRAGLSLSSLTLGGGRTLTQVEQPVAARTPHASSDSNLHSVGSSLGSVAMAPGEALDSSLSQMLTFQSSMQHQLHAIASFLGSSQTPVTAYCSHDPDDTPLA